MTIEIKLNHGLTALFDEVDADLLEMKWHTYGKDGNRYAKTTSRFGGHKMHILVCERKIGRKLEKGELVDHRNGNKVDNRRENLRPASYTQNGANVSRPRPPQSGYRGVRPTKSGTFSAKINAGRIIHLGTFPTAEEAYKAYCDAAKELHGEFARFE